MEKTQKANKQALSGFWLLIPGYVLGILFDQLFFNHYLGVSYPIFTFLALGTFILLLKIQNNLKFSLNWLFFIPPIILSIMFAIQDNQVLRLLNLILIPILLFGTLILISSEQNLKWYKLSFIGKFFQKINHLLANVGTTYQDTFKTAKVSNDAFTTIKKILVGLFIGIIFAIVIGGILTQADAIFSQYVNDFFAIFGEIKIGDSAIHFLQIVVISTIFCAALYAIINVHKFRKSGEPLKIMEDFDPIVTSVALSIVTIIYFLFGIVQFVYLFGGDSNIFVSGLTFAQYAVKGFWELVLVSLINLVIILVTIKNTKLISKASKIIMKTILLLINALTFVLIASAHLRLSLYEQTYGFTHSRIYAHVTILFLFLLFIFAVYKIFIKRFNMMKPAIIIALTLYTVLNLINMEGLIVKQNIERFYNTGKLDINYIERLSADAVPAYIDFYNKGITQEDYKGKGWISFEKKIKDTVNVYKDKIAKETKEAPWFSYNASRSNATKILNNL